MRKVLATASCALLATGVPFLANAAHATGRSDPNNVTVSISGTESFQPNGLKTTYHFPDAPIKVNRGGFITFVNNTNDFHTITLVDAGAVPTSFNCSLCDAVNQTYGGGNGPPAGLQIDAGHLTDDPTTDTQTDTDPDTPDPNYTPGVLPIDPSQVLIEDFDTPGTYGPGPDFTPVVGDSTLVAPSGFPSPNFQVLPNREIQVTAAPGTYHYICTFHPWMQGTIEVH